MTLHTFLQFNDAESSPFRYMWVYLVFNVCSFYGCVQRPPHGFQVNMKLEAVDKRSPGLIRVATVQEVDTHRIKVHTLISLHLIADVVALNNCCTALELSWQYTNVNVQYNMIKYCSRIVFDDNSLYRLQFLYSPIESLSNY